MSGYGKNAYKQTSITTASRGQILIMLYEAAIQNIRKACVCIDNKDIAGKGKHIIKAHDILNELVTTLDHNIGGEISKELERLYNFCIEQLIKANMNTDKVPLQGAEKVLTTLLSGWREAVQKFQNEQNAGSKTG